MEALIILHTWEILMIFVRPIPLPFRLQVRTVLCLESGAAVERKGFVMRQQRGITSFRPEISQTRERILRFHLRNSVAGETHWCEQSRSDVPWGWRGRGGFDVKDTRYVLSKRKVYVAAYLDKTARRARDGRVLLHVDWIALTPIKNISVLMGVAGGERLMRAVGWADGRGCPSVGPSTVSGSVHVF